MSAILLFAGCTGDQGPDMDDQSILPLSFAVDIPNSLSHESGKKSAPGIDTLKGNDVYEHLRFFIKMGEHSAEIVEDIISGIHLYRINQPMEVTFERERRRRQGPADLLGP